MRFIYGWLLTAVPCSACHQPGLLPLDGSRAGHSETATTTSSGGGCITGVDASSPWTEAELATAGPPPRPAAAAAAAAAAALPGSMQAPRPTAAPRPPAASALPGSMQAPPGRNRAGHIRTATTTSCSDSSSSSIAGRGT
ncbi:hypothetical protein PF002_g17799 [Phytophthora fragariae]|uniref:Cytochrome c domain-containing protein n=1 Tax=Phytophthora fragariae TaxID=53985 RepID=A0A6A3Y8T4_9STRA|nr:hypothetical protein PF002_g17799 [Phytophthora fragariae]